MSELTSKPAMPSPLWIRPQGHALGICPHLSGKKLAAHPGLFQQCIRGPVARVAGRVVSRPTRLLAQAHAPRVRSRDDNEAPGGKPAERGSTTKATETESTGITTCDLEHLSYAEAPRPALRAGTVQLRNFRAARRQI